MFWKDKCFGSVSVGPRGEVVIPAEARRDFGIQRGDKFLVFGNQQHRLLVLVDADQISELVSRTMEQLTQLSSTLETEGKEER